MHKLSTLPLFEQLEQSENILISGAGGGFDIYSGIPLYLALKKMNKNVYLSNFSFTFLQYTDAVKECDSCWRISHDMTEELLPSYFPEKFLSIWLNDHGFSSTVYGFEEVGVVPLKKAYEHLVAKHTIDTIILVDGGTDSLMFGDEPRLGTPTEDMTSIIAVSQLNVKQTFLTCIGFGVDYFHGVEHYYFLENVATLTKQQAFLGVWALLPQMEEASLFNELIEYVNNEMYAAPSIVANSINSAVQGNYGDYHATYRTKKSVLWINPIMSFYWAFKLEGVYNNIKYAETLKHTYRFEEVETKIAEYRETITPKKSQNIPV